MAGLAGGLPTTRAVVVAERSEEVDDVVAMAHPFLKHAHWNAGGGHPRAEGMT